MSDVDVKDKIKVRKKKSINSKVPKTYFVILLNSCIKVNKNIFDNLYRFT